MTMQCHEPEWPDDGKRHPDSPFLRGALFGIGATLAFLALLAVVVTR